MKQRRRWEQQWDLSALRAARRSRRAPRRAEERPTPCSSRNTLNFGHRSVAYPCCERCALDPFLYASGKNLWFCRFARSKLARVARF